MLHLPVTVTENGPPVWRLDHAFVVEGGTLTRSQRRLQLKRRTVSDNVPATVGLEDRPFATCQE